MSYCPTQVLGTQCRSFTRTKLSIDWWVGIPFSQFFIGSLLYKSQAIWLAKLQGWANNQNAPATYQCLCDLELSSRILPCGAAPIMPCVLFCIRSVCLLTSPSLFFCLGLSSDASLEDLPFTNASIVFHYWDVGLAFPSQCVNQWFSSLAVI